MPSYGQFCPVAKATEIIGEKWTLLILRELLLGTCRFNDFQRSLSRMSPTILTKRLKHLEERGVVGSSVFNHPIVVAINAVRCLTYVSAFNLRALKTVVLLQVFD